MMACGGGEGVETLAKNIAPGDGFPATFYPGWVGRTIAADDANVFAVSAQGVLLRIPLDGGSVVTLLPDLQGAYELKTDTTHVYWVNGTSANALPLDGGSVQTWTPPQGEVVQDIAPSGGDRVFWAVNLSGSVNSSILRAFPDQPDVAAAAVANLSDNIQSFDADDDSLYWISPDGLFTRNNQDPSGEPITKIAPQADFMALTADRIIWAQHTEADGAPPEIHALAKDGGVDQVIATGVHSVHAMAADGEFVYFSAEIPDCIERVPLSGGPVQHIAKASGEDHTLAINSDSVFWVDSTGDLRRLRKSDAPSSGSVCSN